MAGQIRLRNFLPILATLSQLVLPMNAQFSLYLDQKETLRLLGLATEIYYVKDGKVEDYPLTFVMPIPANVSDLNFSWENRASTEIPYRILINVTSNHNALLEPRLSIPATGFVSHRKDVWSVELPCSGEVSAEVDVTIVVHASMRLLSGARRRHRQVLSHTSSGTGTSSLSNGPTSGLAASSIDGVPDIVVPLKRRKVCVQGARDVPPSASGAKGRHNIHHHHKSRVGMGHSSVGMTSGGVGADSSSMLLFDGVSVKKSDTKTEPPLLASPSDVFFIVTGSVIGAIFVTVALGLAVYWTRRKYAFAGSPPGSSLGQTTATRDCVMVSTFAGSPVNKIPPPISSSSTASGGVAPSSAVSGPQVMLLPPHHQHGHHQNSTDMDAGSGLLSAGTEVNLVSPMGSMGLPVQAMSMTSPEPTLEESSKLLQIIPVGPRSAGASTSSGGSAVMATSQTSASSWHLLVPSGQTPAFNGTYGPIPNGADLWDRVAELRLDGSRLLIRRHEEEGNVGKIYTGVLMGSVSEPQEVTVKSLKVTAGQPYCKILLEEGLLTKGLAHPNLMSLLGVIGGRPYDKVPPSLVYPYAGGNLKRYLQRCRYNKMSALNTTHVVHMGAQVANALAYLHRQGVVHGDVATRNCVVDSSLTVKLTDACLSRDLFPSDYHMVPGLGPVPVPAKWLPVEGVRTMDGDVWSLGVLLWELVTLAADPFPEISPLEFLAFLRTGYRLGQPEHCPDQLFTLMTQCWFEVPERRPDPQTVCAYLQELQMQLQNFI